MLFSLVFCYCLINDENVTTIDISDGRVYKTVSKSCSLSSGNKTLVELSRNNNVLVQNQFGEFVLEEICLDDISNVTTREQHWLESRNFDKCCHNFAPFTFFRTLDIKILGYNKLWPHGIEQKAFQFLAVNIGM